MKKLLVAGLGLIVLVGAGFGAYRLGWIGRSSGATTPGAAATTGMQTARPGPAGPGESPQAVVSQETLARAVEAIQASSGALTAELAGTGFETASPADASLRLDRLLKAIDTIDREGLEAETEPTALARRLGPDPENAFQWVRNSTVWAPYRGTLRGPVGVLMDRTGNSLDRSLLLAAMLAANGHRVRLAHATLTGQQADAIFPQVSASSTPADATSGIDAVVSRAFDDYARESGADTAKLRELLAVSASDSSTVLTGFRQEADSHASTLRAALGPVAAVTGTVSRADIEALRDHWWVQRQDGQAWQDLDTLNPDGKAGSALAVAEDTPETSQVPADLHHRVRIRIVVERLSAGRLEEEAVIESVFDPVDAWGQKIGVYHVPVYWPAALAPREGEAPRSYLDRVETTVASQKVWMVAIAVGTATRRVVIDQAGRIVPVKGEPTAAGVGRMSGALGGAEEPDSSELTAEWIDYELQVPGQVPRTIRRPFFDVVGPARRAAGQPPRTLTAADQLTRAWAMLGEVETLAEFSRTSPLAVTHLICRELLSRRERIVAAVREGKPGQLARELATIRRLASPLYTLAVGRWAWGGEAQDVYLDHPNLLTLRSGFSRRDGELVGTAAFDLVDNQVAVRPHARSRAFLVSMQQGVIDTGAERLVLGNGRPAFNTMDVFNAAAAAGVNPQLIRAGDPGLAGFAIGEDARARLKADLDSGFLAVVPGAPAGISSPSRTGWWRVRPDTGETVGVMDDGLHSSAAVDRAILEKMVAAVIAGGEGSVGIALGYVAKMNWVQVANMLGGGRWNIELANKVIALLKAVRDYEQYCAGRC